MISGGRPSLLRDKLADTDPPADFLSIFARSYRRSQDFLWRCTFFLKKVDELF